MRVYFGVSQELIQFRDIVVMGEVSIQRYIAIR